MSKTLYPCPQCSGAGVLRAALHPIEWECDLCAGKGAINEERQAAREAGRKAREERLQRRVTLRQEAERLGISPSALSRRERGVPE